MYKAFLFGTALTVSVTAMVIMAPNSARFAFAGSEPYTVAEDSVFMDEGDGDFAAAPPAPVAAAPAPETAKKTSKKKAAKATKPAEPTRKTASEDEAASAAGPGSLDDLEAAAASTASEPAAPVEMSEPAPAQVAAPEEAPMMEATPEAAPESAPVEASKKAPKNSKKSKVAKAEKKSGTKGKFANTKTECPLLREPASDSEKMIVVKAPRKIWVEEVDGSWVRAFNKAGEPGYVSTECFE